MYKMVTKGHHTCRKDGGKEEVIKNAPFLAEHTPNEKDPKKQKLQFLGQGYYFWDNNFEMARIWGKSDCNNHFFIIECEIEISETKCFDLVGNRNHQIFLIDMLKKMKNKGYNRDHWEISKCIEYLKLLAKHDHAVFPYESIRAIDYLPPHELQQIEFHFVKGNKHYTILNPKMAICALKKETLALHTVKLVYES